MAFDRARFAKIMAMTTSSHDGEKLAALDRANAMLRDAKMTWADVLAGDRANVNLNGQAYGSSPFHREREEGFTPDGGYWYRGTKDYERRRREEEAASYDQGTRAYQRRQQAEEAAEREAAARAKAETTFDEQVRARGEQMRAEMRRKQAQRDAEAEAQRRRHDNSFWKGQSDDWADDRMDSVRDDLDAENLSRSTLQGLANAVREFMALHPGEKGLRFTSFAARHPELAVWLHQQRVQNVLAHSVVERILGGEEIDDALLGVLRRARDARSHGGI